MSTEASAEVSPPIHPPMLLPPGEGPLPSPPTESRPSSSPSAPPSPPPAPPCPPPPSSPPPPPPPANSPQSSRIASRPATPDDTLDVMEFVTPEDGGDGTVTASKQGKRLKENDGRKESSGHARGSNKDTGKSSSTAKDKKRVAECGDDDTSGPGTSGRAKRRKVSKDKDTAATPSNTERPPRLDLPKDAPKWAVNAIKLFKQEDVPQQLLQLVETWINFETCKKNWLHTGKLSTMDRPKPVGNWINHARTDHFHLQAVKSGVDPVKDFESKFWLWWSQLQPEFWQRDESDIALALDNKGWPDTTSEGDWEILRLLGMNGWLLSEGIIRELLLKFATADPDCAWLQHTNADPIFIVVEITLADNPHHPALHSTEVIERVWRNCSDEEVSAVGNVDEA
ncbi:hypothetical protein ARMGADRAFT_1089139 [Armillaria gallica]|uniref:Uncharacterized protein n=1 Tax=Armillaria gallica TaxID=47427 RepID=A0A2H3CKT1_ARMGA|nr:hypothetical protein ARMGADRAFT_1089139 [Armillaria gallica]